MNHRPNILIFHDHLLPRSETFIRSQTQALQFYQPYYAGSRRVNGLPLPTERTITINRLGEWGRFTEIPFKLFGFAPRFFRKIRSIDPLLIHAHFGPDGALALPLARALQVPLIVTFGGFDATVTREAIPYPFYNSHHIYFRKEVLLKQEARLFIAVSQFIKGKLIERDFPPERLVVHYRGVDTQLLRPDPEIPRQSTVLFAGRLVEVKGVEYLIRAMKYVQNQVMNARLVIAGDGPLRADLEKLAREENITDYRFVGWRSHDEIAQWLKQARVCCMPSIAISSGAEEGLPNVVIEAMACGLPVVSFASGGNPEAIVHGKTGFLAPEKDVRQLSAYIIQLLTDDGLWHAFSQAGRSRAKLHFDLVQQTAKLEELYHSILSDSAISLGGTGR